MGAKAEAELLEDRLKTINQGDVIQLGAVTLVGRGPAPAGLAARVAQENQVDLTGTGDWSVTIKSDIGWYVVCSQDCDIVRSTEQEPCLLVCPLRSVTTEKWKQLRHGPYSPRDFPYPDVLKLGIALPDGHMAVADARYMTSVLKVALLSDDVEVLRPLTINQKDNFGRWLGRRINRAAFSDRMQTDVLDVAATRLRDLLKQHAKAAAKGEVAASLAARLVACATEWYIAGSEKRIEYKLVITASLARAVKFWDENTNSFKLADIERATGQLIGDLRKRMPDDGGYMCDLRVVTYESVRLDEYLSWSPWIWERSPDLLGEDVDETVSIGAETS